MFFSLFLSVGGLFSSKDNNPSIIIEDYPFKLCYVITTGILFFCSSLLGIQDAFGKWKESSVDLFRKKVTGTFKKFF